MKLRARRSWEDVPDDVWELIFGRLDDHPHRLDPVSLVNKRFLAVAGRIHADLTLPTFVVQPARIQSRFPNIRSLHLAHPHPDLPAFISQLARTNLPLQSLRLSDQPRFPGPAMRLLACSSAATLESLSCIHFHIITDDDLVLIGDCFPHLRRLDLVHDSIATTELSITDRGILALSTKLRSLVSFTSRFHQVATSRSIHHLSSNCPSITRFRARFGTQNPIHFHDFASFPSLSSLDLHHVSISETGLAQLTRANLKLLHNLALCNPLFVPGDMITRATLCEFLKSCSSLRRLKLKFMDFPSEMSGEDFAQSIPNVQVLIVCNVQLTYDTEILFDLLLWCPKLEEVVLTMNYVGIGNYEDGPPLHPGLRKLVLAGCDELNDETLMAVAPICPNLEHFYFGSMDEITEVGVEAMKANCPNLKICERLKKGEWDRKPPNHLQWFEL